MGGGCIFPLHETSTAFIALNAPRPMYPVMALAILKLGFIPPTILPPYARPLRAMFDFWTPSFALDFFVSFAFLINF